MERYKSIYGEASNAEVKFVDSNSGNKSRNFFGFPKSAEEEWFELFSDWRGEEDSSDYVKVANKFLKKYKSSKVITDMLGISDDGDITWMVKTV